MSAEGSNSIDIGSRSMTAQHAYAAEQAVLILEKNIALRENITDFCKPLAGSDEQSLRTAIKNHTVWVQSVNETLEAEHLFLKGLHLTLGMVAEQLSVRIDELVVTNFKNVCRKIDRKAQEHDDLRPGLDAARTAMQQDDAASVEDSGNAVEEESTSQRHSECAGENSQECCSGEPNIMDGLEVATAVTDEGRVVRSEDLDRWMQSMHESLYNYSEKFQKRIMQVSKAEEENARLIAEHADVCKEVLEGHANLTAMMQDKINKSDFAKANHDSLSDDVRDLRSAVDFHAIKYTDAIDVWKKQFNSRFEQSDQDCKAIQQSLRSWKQKCTDQFKQSDQAIANMRDAFADELLQLSNAQKYKHCELAESLRRTKHEQKSLSQAQSECMAKSENALALSNTLQESVFLFQLEHSDKVDASLQESRALQQWLDDFRQEHSAKSQAESEESQVLQEWMLIAERCQRCSAELEESMQENSELQHSLVSLRSDCNANFQEVAQRNSIVQSALEVLKQEGNITKRYFEEESSDHRRFQEEWNTKFVHAEEECQALRQSVGKIVQENTKFVHAEEECQSLQQSVEKLVQESRANQECIEHEIRSANQSIESLKQARSPNRHEIIVQSSLDSLRQANLRLEDKVELTRTGMDILTHNYDSKIENSRIFVQESLESFRQSHVALFKNAQEDNETLRHSFNDLKQECLATMEVAEELKEHAHRFQAFEQKHQCDLNLALSMVRKSDDL